MKTAFVGILLTVGPVTTTSYAQDRLMESVVVTGTRVNSDPGLAQNIPNIRLRVTADFVLFEATFVNGDLDLATRKTDLETTFDRVRSANESRRDIEILIGDSEQSYALETTTFEEAYNGYGQRGAFEVALRVDTRDAETYETVRARVEDFLDGIEGRGLVQYFIADEQYIGLRNPERFRPELMSALSDEVNRLSETFVASEVTVTGLDQRTVTQPTGALSLDVYVPYSLTIVSKR